MQHNGLKAFVVGYALQANVLPYVLTRQGLENNPCLLFYRQARSKQDEYRTTHSVAQAQLLDFGAS